MSQTEYNKLRWRKLKESETPEQRQLRLNKIKECNLKRYRTDEAYRLSKLAHSSKLGKETHHKNRAEWFANKVCVDCGSNKDLEMDHIDQNTKITDNVWKSSKELRESELAKCEPRCKHCHRIKSNKQLNRPIRHGEHSGYSRGCRCAECKQAHSTYNTQNFRDRVKNPSRFEAPITHGTHQGYKRGCKCDECVTFRREYSNKLKMKDRAA